MRGYGETDRPAEIERYTLLHLVGDAVGVLDSLGEKNAVIVGHDWGAPVAWPLAWSELAKLPSAHEATVENAASLLLKRKADPWKAYFAGKQILPLDKLAC